MSARLQAEIDGRNVPLAECDWVLWGPCGCPFGVTTGSKSPTEDDAWENLYGRDPENARTIRRVMRAGYRVELMPHERYCAEVSDRMRTRCIHPATSAGSTR